MTIGGPGGVGGPKGPGGVGGTSAPEVDGVDDAHDVDATAGARDLDAAHAVSSPDVERLAADLAAGRITPQQAVDHMVDQIANGAPLGAAERAELRELIVDLVANDPYLGGLIGRI
jgi:hypothetical protein